MNKQATVIPLFGDRIAAEGQRLERAFRDHNLALDQFSVVMRATEQAVIAPNATEQASDARWFDSQSRTE